MKFSFRLVSTGLLFGFMTLAHSTDWEKLPPWAAAPPWPDKVELATPDPVLGKEDIYETWAYTGSFARRFSNLPVEQANKGMPPGLQAVAFRVYRHSVFPMMYPKQPLYWCAMDLYVDDEIARGVVSEGGYKTPNDSATENAGYSLPRLKSVSSDDESERRSKGGATGRARDWAIIFFDGLLDSRYSKLGITLQPVAPKGMHVFTLETDLDCQVVWPWRTGQQYIISLLGNDPYQANQLRVQAQNEKLIVGNLWEQRVRYLLRSGTTYRWESGDAVKGLFALPEDFVRRILNKVLAVKAFNSCIDYEEAFAAGRYSKALPEWRKRRLDGCRNMKETGEVYHARKDQHNFEDVGESRRYRPEIILKP